MDAIEYDRIIDKLDAEIEQKNEIIRQLKALFASTKNEVSLRLEKIEEIENN